MKKISIIIALFLILSMIFCGCSEITGVDTDDIVASSQTHPSPHAPDVDISGAETSLPLPPDTHISGA